MKKLFFAICFISLTALPLQAKVVEVLDTAALPEAQSNLPKEPAKIHNITAEELSSFLDQRLEKTKIDEAEKITSKNIYVEPSQEARAMQEEAKKGAFQKIYDEAMRRATGGNSAAAESRPDLQNNDSLPPSLLQQQEEWNQPDFPVIHINLPPDNRQVLVPAREHIPYLMNNIEILSNGMVKFNETAVIVAGDQKLRRGLSKILPRYIYARDGKRQSIHYELLKVTANGEEIPYRFKTDGPRILMVPADGYQLEPGVYQFNFQYLADRILWDYGDFKEFYWDISGNNWNLVISRAGATITLPPGVEPLGQETLIGYPDHLQNNAIETIRPSANTFGYAAKLPLYVGEGFHLILSLPENAVSPLTFGKKLVNWFEQKGDSSLAALALAAIWLAFAVSAKYIKVNKGQLKIKLKKNAVMLRYLWRRRYDKISFFSFLLELYRKNIIDIQQAEQTILLIKRTDHLQSLSKAEQKAVSQLFSGSDAVFNVNKANLLKIRRASDLIEKELEQRLQSYLLKLNSGYLFFSLAMLLTTEFFMAQLSYNPGRMFGLLALLTAIMLSGVWLFAQRDPRLWKQILFKTAGSLLAGMSIVSMAAIISLPAVGLIFAALIIIKYYTSAYARKGGLLKSQIEESEKLRHSLAERKDDILLGREILSQQANIMALDLADEFISTDNNSEYNKLGIIRTMIQKLS